MQYDIGNESERIRARARAEIAAELLENTNSIRSRQLADSVRWLLRDSERLSLISRQVGGLEEFHIHELQKRAKQGLPGLGV